MSYIVQEYYCEGCVLRFEETLERPAPPSFGCPLCGDLAESVISAPRLKFPLATFERGKPAEMPSPLAMDTEPLADGMPYSEWRDRRRKVFDEERRKRIRSKLG